MAFSNYRQFVADMVEAMRNADEDYLKIEATEPDEVLATRQALREAARILGWRVQTGQTDQDPYPGVWAVFERTAAE